MNCSTAKEFVYNFFFNNSIYRTTLANNFHIAIALLHKLYQNWLKLVVAIKIYFMIKFNTNPVGICLFKGNNKSTRTRCEICLNLTIKTPDRRHWRRFGVSIVNFEHISHLVLVFPLLTLSKQIPTGYDPTFVFE